MFGKSLKKSKSPICIGKMTKREESVIFFDFWASFYDTWLNPFRIWLTHIQKQVSKHIIAGKVLDIGCGTGDLLLMLDKKRKTQKAKLNLYGIDISGKMLEKARKNLGSKAIVQYGDVENIPFKNDYFDIITSTEAFHHYEHAQKAISEMYRVVKKNGFLFLADISIKNSIIRKLFFIIEPGHVKIYSKKEFRLLLENAGFKVEKHERVGLLAVLNIAKKH